MVWRCCVAVICSRDALPYSLGSTARRLGCVDGSMRRRARCITVDSSDRRRCRSDWKDMELFAMTTPNRHDVPGRERRDIEFSPDRVAAVVQALT